MSSRDVSGPYRPAPETGDYGRPWPGHRASDGPRGGYDGAGYPGGRRRRDDSSGRDGDEPALRGRGRPGDGWGDYPAGNAPAPAAAGYRTPARAGQGGARRSAGNGTGGYASAASGTRTGAAYRRDDRYENGRSGAGRPAGSHGGATNGRGGGRGNGPGRGKVKGSWWRHWTWRKVAGLAAAGFGGLILLCVAGVSYAYAKTAVPTDVSQAAMQQQSTVYFSDGKTVLGTFGNTDRQLLQYNQISPLMRDAVVAAEDRSFYTEGGVSPKGIVRAAYEDVFNGGGTSGGSLQGGSTITQQFVRNYYANIGSQQTASRKIKEIFVALKVAKEKSKAWILTNYLNTIYLGQGAYGVGAAAETYFGIPVSQVDAAQAAYIAAIIQSPSYYPTPAGQPALMTRWRYVLDGMVTLGDLSAQQAAAERFPNVLSAQDQHVGSDPYDSYVLGLVDNELQSRYKFSQAQIDNGGLHVTTTISKPMMDQLYSAVNQNEKLMAEDGGPLPSYGLVGAELQNPQTGAIAAFYGGPGENVPAKYCHNTCSDNTVLTREQVGSSFKPYVLATAVAQGMNVQTTKLDGYSPLWIPPDSQAMTPAARSQADAGPGYFEETNDGDESYGPMSVAQAEAQSSNTAFTDLIHRVGNQSVVNMAKQFGVDVQASGLQTDVGVGMALGQDSLSVNEQDTMLASLDDNGTYHPAHIIAQISQGSVSYPAKVSSTQVLTPVQDSQVQYAMSFDTINGTGTAAAMSDGRPIIAKTGTTDDAQSAFFIGAIPQYALTVGIFTDSQSPKSTETLNDLGGNVGGGFGGYWPARIWNTFAENEFAQLPIEDFPAPQFSGSTWNMFGAGMLPPASPSPTQSAHPRTRPTAPVNRPTQPANPFPAPTPTALPTCGPLTGRPCHGKGGNGGPQPGANGDVAGAGAAGFVTLIPLGAFRRRRKRKRR
ncbi:MAG: transglycosylase domain-containing protein [Streptosporangiaceae bacterium]